MFESNRLRATLASVLAVSCLTMPALAQRRTSPAYTGTGDLRDVRPFVSWFTDAVITQGIDIEPFLTMFDDDADGVMAGARFSVWAVEALEVGGQMAYLDIQDGDSGLSDFLVYGRYALDMGEDLPDITVGGHIDLPTGEENVGESTVDFTIFAASRFDLVSGWTIHANAGLESLEFNDDRESGLLLGGGLIAPITGSLAALGEINIGNNDYAAATFGADYELPPGNHLRAGFSIGLDDGAPDLVFQLAMSIPVY